MALAVSLEVRYLQKPWIFSVIGLAGFLLVSWALISYGIPLVFPFVFALLVAEFVNPVVNLLSKKAKIPRTLSVSVVLLLLIGVVSVLLTVGIGYLVDEIELLIANLPYLYALGMDLGSQFAEQFARFHDGLPLTIQEQLAGTLGELQEDLKTYLGTLVGSLGVVASLPSFLINSIIAVVATFLIARDRDQINAFLLSLFPVEWRPGLRQVKNQVWTSAIGWGKAQLMLIMLTMLQSIIGLSIIGSNYAVLVGILVGLVDVMPILGPGAVFIPWAVYSFIFGSKIFGIKLLVLYGILVGVRQVMESKLVGDQIGLHPLAVLLAIYLGITFFGALGVIFGPLLAILLKAMITSGLLPIFPDESRNKKV